MQDKITALMTEIDKKGFSFYVVDRNNNRISSTWVIKKDIRKKDGAPSIYAYQRTFGGKMKLSLHHDHCQWGLVGEYAERNKSQGWGTFAPILWKRSETPDEGAIYVASIRFVTDFMKGDFSQYNEAKKPTFCFEAAPAGQSINVGIFYSKEKPDTLEKTFISSGITPFFCFDLGNGEYVTITFGIQNNPYKLPAEFNNKKRVGHEIEPVLNKHSSQGNIGAVLVYTMPIYGTPLELVEVSGLRIKKA